MRPLHKPPPADAHRGRSQNRPPRRCARSCHPAWMTHRPPPARATRWRYPCRASSVPPPARATPRIFDIKEFRLPGIPGIPLAKREA